jgi:hypothetical protein
MPIYWYTFNQLVRQNVHGYLEGPTSIIDLSKVSVS